MSKTITRYNDGPTSETTYLDQIVDIDGEQAIEETEPIYNASGRLVGYDYTVSDETWDFIQESIRRGAEYEVA